MTATNPRCTTTRQGDEYVCQCGLRWEIDAERPTCKELAAPAPQTIPQRKPRYRNRMTSYQRWLLR